METGMSIDASNTLTLALVQFDIAWDNISANFARCVDLVAQAASKGAELVLLPEMFLTGFSFPRGEHAAEAHKRGNELLMECARKHKITVGGSLPSPRDGQFEKPFNTFFLYNREGRKIAEYSKVHLFSYSEETQLYSAGDSIVTVTIDGWRVSLFICYDLRFPLPFASLAQSTDLFVVVANWPESRREHWKTLLKARAIENQAYVAGVNRVGEGGELRYSGDSAVINPLGETVCSSEYSEEILISTLSLEEVSNWRKRFSCLVDRKDDLTHLLLV
jgi:predicted amidohydrolase